VALGSRSHPVLVSSIAERIASVGRLPVLGSTTPVGSAPRSGGNSAQRVIAVHGSFRVDGELAAALSTVDGPLLLVDDRIDTGWTMTLVARELRQAGIADVYPLALALDT
jgi:ATP-dependent DNA helicase RecQ